MHYVHLIAIEAENEADAIQEAEASISQYGDGDVWDWYEVGGRWDGYLAGKNALRYSDGPATFMEALEGAKRARSRSMREILDQLSGKQLAPGEVEDVFGFGIPDPVGAARRVSDQNTKMKQEFDSLLAAADPLAWTETQEFSLLGHYLYKLGKMVAGYYSTDSYFYDGTAMDPAFRYAEARIKTDPRTQWLVTVDLHN